MPEETSYGVTLLERQYVKVTGILHVGSFSDKEIEAETTLGNLILQGKDLHIAELNLQAKILVIEGYINSLTYQDSKKKDRQSFWKKMFR